MTTIINFMVGIRNICYLKFGIHVAISIALLVAVEGGVGYFCAAVMKENINSLFENKWYLIGALVILG